MTKLSMPPISKEIKFASPNDPNLSSKLIAYLERSSQKNLLENKTVYARLHESINELYEKIANNPEEHAIKLQESYRLLKMQPRYSGESDDEFRERLLQNTKASSTVISDKENSLLAEARKYLAKYAAPRIKPVYALNVECRM